MMKMRKLEDNFRYKGVDFSVIKRGKNAIILLAEADFYDCESVEVWQLRYSKDREINGVFVEGGEIKPSNEDYPLRAHQFMRKHFKSGEDFVSTYKKRFNEYERGERPKPIIE